MSWPRHVSAHGPCGEFDRYELDRLAQRDLTSSGFIPAAGAPMFIAEQFAAAARARAGLAAALPQQPLPQQGDHIEGLG
jgi:hypothetical protein